MDDYPAAEPIPDPSVEFSYQGLMEFLADNDDMRKTAKSSFKQGLIAGAGAMGGGMFFGPPGGLIGGIVGSLVGYLTADDYEGVVKKLSELHGIQSRRNLVESVVSILRQADSASRQFRDQDEFKEALMEFASQRDVRDQIWTACLQAINDDTRS